MPCISGRSDPRIGPLLQVAITSFDFTQKGVADGQASPALHMYQALIDTGASGTCISDKVVSDVGLAATGKTMIAGATGQAPVDQFAFGVGFLLNPVAEPTGQVSGGLVMHKVQGSLFHGGAGAFDVLLGRDIICKGALHMSFDGHFTLSM